MPSGGIIVQFSYGLGIYPPNATIVCERWQEIHNEGQEKDNRTKKTML
jgi:hypothetical protein